MLQWEVAQEDKRQVQHHSSADAASNLDAGGQAAVFAVPVVGVAPTDFMFNLDPDDFVEIFADSRAWPPPTRAPTESRTTPHLRTRPGRTIHSPHMQEGRLPTSKEMRETSLIDPVLHSHAAEHVDIECRSEHFIAPLPIDRRRFDGVVDATNEGATDDSENHSTTAADCRATAVAKADASSRAPSAMASRPFLEYRRMSLVPSIFLMNP